MSKQHFAVPVWLCHESVHHHNVCTRACVAYYSTLNTESIFPFWKEHNYYS